MIKIGCRAHDFDYHDPENLLGAVKKAGYEAVQLACPKSFGWAYPLDEAQAEAINRASEKHGVEITVLGCYVDMAVRDKEKREEAIKKYINGLKTGKALNVRCVGTETVNFHGPMSERREMFDILADAVKRAAEEAEKLGVNMGIEPVFDHTLWTPEMALELKEKVGSDRIKWIWDAINLLDPNDPEENAVKQKKTAELLGKDIVAMHIKDARYKDTKVKKECPLFEGEYDWQFPFEWAARQKDMVLLREQAIEDRSAAEIAGMKKLLGMG